MDFLWHRPGPNGRPKTVKFWADQNVMFDWTADITGTGDRSEYIVESD